MDMRAIWSVFLGAGALLAQTPDALAGFRSSFH